jgi:hypothetical protein
LCRLYLHGGPAHEDEERQVRRALEELAQAHPRRMPVLPAELSFSRAVTALQRAESAACADALERATLRCREIDQREGLWHAERARLLLRINAGTDSDAASGLTALHLRAERQSLWRTAPFSGFDRAVVLPELGHPPVLDATLRRALAYERSDPPSVWSMKVRALATAGWVEAAHASLRALEASELAKLPCDRDYLGTLGHLARAALLLGARDYAQALYPLLAPYPEHFATHVSFWAEGSVSQLLGMLAAELGQGSQAIAHLQAGIAQNERAGLVRAADQARAQLAQSRKSS